MVVRAITPVPITQRVPSNGLGERCSAANAAEAAVRVALISEASRHVIDSMFNQHAKWLSICNELPWRQNIASLNLLITSTVWRQDHNGFTHQDPGFLDVVVNKRAEVTRIYLPPDVNSLLSVANHCLRSENYINVIVSDKQLHLQYLDMTS